MTDTEKRLREEAEEFLNSIGEDRVSAVAVAAFALRKQREQAEEDAEHLLMLARMSSRQQDRDTLKIGSAAIRRNAEERLK